MNVIDVTALDILLYTAYIKPQKEILAKPVIALLISIDNAPTISVMNAMPKDTLLLTAL
jgi:hypothetical protein